MVEKEVDKRGEGDSDSALPVVHSSETVPDPNMFRPLRFDGAAMDGNSKGKGKNSSFIINLLLMGLLVYVNVFD